jgi:hypothetical protein
MPKERKHYTSAKILKHPLYSTPWVRCRYFG